MTEAADTDSESYLENFLSSAFGAGAGDFESVVSRTEDLEELPLQVGPYVVSERIGHGGMGQVFRVLDPELGREIAIKVIREHLADDPAVVQRFRAEAKLCSQLQHPGVVPIHELGTTEDGRPYFTMKVIEGRTLDRILRDLEPAQRGEVLATFGRICDTLAYVHSHGVVHGDMKPQNVMVGAFGEVQVMDWGFAREVGVDSSAGRPSREPGQVRVFGTPSYMAPEQAVGDGTAIDTRTDVFGLGAVLCEILSGEPPYRGATKAETFLQASRGWLDRAHENMRRSGADPALVDLAVACLSLEPGDRPKDAGEVADRVRTHIATAEDRAHRAELRAAEARAVAVQEKRARRLTVALAMTLLIAVIVPSAIYLKWSSDRRDRQETTGRAIAAAMARARVLFLHAASADLGDLEPWTAAQSAAGEAAALAALRDVAPAQAAEVDILVRELEAGRASAVRDQDMADWLLALRPHGLVSDPVALDRGYRDAFQEYGLDVEMLAVSAAAEVVVRSSISRALIHALDEWALLRRHYQVDPPGSWRALLDITCAADPDPWRTELRHAFRDDQRDWLRSEVDLLGTEERDLESMRLLARLLAEVGHRPEAIRVYKMATIRHPEDYWLAHDLASQLGLLQPAPIDEMVRLYSMAAAVQPSSAHALVDLGRALLISAEEKGEGGEGSREDALRDGTQVLRRAVDLDPSDARSHAMYGIGLSRLGRLKEAEASLTQAMDLGFASGIGSDLAAIQIRRGRYDEALATLETSVVSARERRGRMLQRCDLLIQDYRYDEARDLAESILAEDPNDPTAHWFLALDHFERGEFAASTEALQTAVEAPESNALPWRDRVDSVSNSLEAAEAIGPDILRGVDPRMGNLSAAALVGHVALRMGHHYTAFRFYERVLGDATDVVGLFSAIEAAEAAARVAAGSWDPGQPADEREQERAAPICRQLVSEMLDRMERIRDDEEASAQELLVVLRRLDKNPAIVAARAASPEEWAALENRREEFTAELRETL